MLRIYPPPERGQADEPRLPGVVLDYTDLREFAEGKIANVFGDEYASIDTYHRRARLPLEPFLFVSRVLSMDADNEIAGTGIDSAERGRKAYALASEASERLRNERFEEASTIIQEALSHVTDM